MKQPKQCPHLNTVQVGNPGIIETFCADCNECIGVVKSGSSQKGGVNMMYIGMTHIGVDSHGDIILPGAFKKSEDKYHLKNHKG